MSAGRVLLAGLIALLLAVGASSTANAGPGLRIDVIRSADGTTYYHFLRGSYWPVSYAVATTMPSARLHLL